MTSTVKSTDFRRAPPHTMNRIDVSTGVNFDEFRAAFEKAAPPVDPAPVKQIAESGGSWDDVKAAVAINAPHDPLQKVVCRSHGRTGKPLQDG